MPEVIGSLDPRGDNTIHWIINASLPLLLNYEVCISSTFNVGVDDRQRSFRWKLYENSSITWNCKISFFKNDKMLHTRSHNCTFSAAHREELIFIAFSDEIDQLIPLTDILKISCQLEYIKENTDNFVKDESVDMIEDQLRSKLNFDWIFLGKDLSDVKLLVACGKEIPAHKVVLAAASPVLRAMFTHDMLENKSHSVDINDISYEAAVEMLRYIYIGSVETREFSLIAEVLAAAEKYQLEELKNKCERILGSNLSTENAVQALRIADTYSAKHLRKKAVDFVKRSVNGQLNYDEIRLFDQFWNACVERYESRLVQRSVAVSRLPWQHVVKSLVRVIKSQFARVTNQVFQDFPQLIKCQALITLHVGKDKGTILSPIFNVGSNKFQLDITYGSFYYFEKWITGVRLYLRCKEGAAKLPYKYKISMIKDHKIVQTYSGDPCSDADKTISTITQDEFKTTFISSQGDVIIHCELTTAIGHQKDLLLHEPIDMNQVSVPKYYFNEIYLDKNLSDVKLRSSCGKEIPAHRVVLAAASPVFKAMFSHDMVENKSQSVDMNDISYDAVVEMLRYIYTGSVKTQEFSLTTEVLTAADKYQLDDLKNKCEQILISTLSTENAINVLKVADKYNLSLMKRKVVDFVKHKITESSDSDKAGTMILSVAQFLSE
ncbi:uncharacterized protein LOC106659688 [Trichogramma pretiosum]|uniref:uncharacterized protein LOC106659688 n=1 Tax=Trichogramma pretiosum TaxID=7493 RepID=UPI0006C9C900|nr:uncharacterized protein LOC106659688 [Trichogramma pretiosum]